MSDPRLLIEGPSAGHRHSLTCYWDLFECRWSCPPVTVFPETPVTQVGDAIVLPSKTPELPAVV
jgi:hypothetical protein